MQFFVFGDTPYDKFEDTCYTNCGGFDDCWENGDISTCNCEGCGNKCTYQGRDYDCVRDSIIPYMNDKIGAGDAAFIAHCGDILGELMGVVASRMYPFSYNFSLLVFPGGGSVASNVRCNEYSFGVRGKLFAEAKNFLDGDLIESFLDLTHCPSIT